MEYLRGLVSSAEAPKAQETPVAKWSALYASKRTPWETQAPASQLVGYCEASDVRGLRAVELCCGTGASLVYLATMGCDLVVGVDVVPAAIEAARARGRRGRRRQVLFRLRRRARAAAASVRPSVRPSVARPPRPLCFFFFR